MFGFNYSDGGPWSEDGVVSMSKFILRLERILDKILQLPDNDNNVINENEKDLLYVFNSSLKGITNDLENMQFNTAIAKIMEITNALYKYDKDVEIKNTKMLKEFIKNKNHTFD